MNHKTEVVAAIFALFCGICITNRAVGQTLPDGKGKAELVRICTACHGTALVTQHRKTAAEWKKTVDAMVARGADGSDAEINNVLLYLDANFGVTKTGSATAAQASPPSSGAGALAASALNLPTADRAKRVIAQNGCLSCHRIENQGGYTGPVLNGVGGRRTTEEIRTAIVSPQPLLDPSNNLVRLTTADGKTLTGRILSENDHDLRVIDGSGAVSTYSMPELRQMTIVDTNPMPSFQGKITGEDLDDLVRYLRSLPSLNTGAQK